MKKQFAANSAGSIMTSNIPVFTATTTCGEALKTLAGDVIWDDIHHLYIVDKNGLLEGFVPIGHLVQKSRTSPLQKYAQQFPETVRSTDDQETAVFIAVKNNLDALPVTDSKNRLLGAITAQSIISALHNEHIEDALIVSGIRKPGTTLTNLATEHIFLTLRTRAPWLVGGALIGILLGLVSSQFEASLEKTIALAYFIPVVAYIADSVGTQSEAITIRALATLNIRYRAYLLRESLIGVCLGIMLGALGAAGAFIISGDGHVSLVVGIALFAASTLATLLASLIPILFKVAGKDPALGSGPLATALQDVLSILVYFLVAMLII